MGSSEKLRVLLIRDMVVFVSLTAAFIVPPEYHIVPIFVCIAALWVAGKQLKNVATKLTLRDRAIFFGSTCIFMLTWICLLLLWIMRHPSLAPVAIGSLGIVILLGLWYNAYEEAYGPNQKV
jgi:hypothetical protein